MRNHLLLSAIDPAHLNLIILPTEKCNFRCTYCYEDYHQGKMTPDIVEGIKNLLTVRAPELKILTLGFFGGEPLLEENILSDLLSHATTLAEAHVFYFSANATTNFYLLKAETLRHFGKLGLSNFQVTMDGDRDFHNTKRFIHHPQGSFDKIWENLILFNDLCNDGDIKEGKVTLRLHLHAENQESLHALATRIISKLSPENFRITFKGIGHYGGENDQDFEAINEQSAVFQQRISALSDVLKGFSASSMLEDEGGTYICYAAKPNTLTIRADGKLAKCTVAFNDPDNDIGTLQKDGSLLFKPERLSKWLQTFQTLDDKVLACPFHYIKKNGPLQEETAPS